MTSTRRRALLASTALALVLSFWRPALAGDPSAAVSAPTVTVEASGGAVGGAPSGFAGATATLPLGDRFGIQIDGALGQSGERGQGGAGGHLFWRDPELGLIGATAMWSRLGGGTVFRYGLETEAYLDDVTIAPAVGLQRGDANKGSSSSGYATLTLSWYALDDLKLSLGGSGFANVRTGFAGVEWQPDAETPLSLFATGGGGNRGPGFGLAGLRYAFGAGASSLKERQRHGDPDNIVSFMSADGGGALALQAQATRPVAPTPTPAPSGGGCFVAGTAVLLADGTAKPIEAVEVGELVRGAGGAANRVERLIRPVLGEALLYALNGGVAFTTDDHPFATPAGWKAINPAAAERVNPGLVVGPLAPGDLVLTAGGELRLAAIVAHSAPAATPLYNFSVAGNRTFFVRPAGAEAFFQVHNKD